MAIYPVVTLGHSWRLSFMHGYGCAEAAISAESCVPGKALETCAEIWLSSTERKKSGAEQALACSTCRLAKNPTHGPWCRVKKKMPSVDAQTVLNVTASDREDWRFCLPVHPRGDSWPYCRRIPCPAWRNRWKLPHHLPGLQCRASQEPPPTLLSPATPAPSCLAYNIALSGSYVRATPSHMHPHSNSLGPHQEQVEAFSR